MLRPDPSVAVYLYGGPCSVMAAKKIVIARNRRNDYLITVISVAGYTVTSLQLSVAGLQLHFF